jgi:hypothetical protein
MQEKLRSINKLTVKYLYLCKEYMVDNFGFTIVAYTDSKLNNSL